MLFLSEPIGDYIKRFAVKSFDGKSYCEDRWKDPTTPSGYVVITINDYGLNKGADDQNRKRILRKMIVYRIQREIESAIKKVKEKLSIGLILVRSSYNSFNVKRKGE